MIRNTRLWQDPGAAAISYEGDAVLGAQWLGYAKAKLSHMLQSTAGPLSATFTPVSEVSIRIDTRPNRIHINAGGGLFVTVVDKLSAVGDYPNIGLAPYQDRSDIFLYSLPNSKRVKTQFYNSRWYNQSFPAPSLPEGFWIGGSVALSWRLPYTFYIGGKFGDIAILPDSVNIVTGAHVKITTTLLTRFPALSGYTRALILLCKKNTPLEYTLRVYGVKENTPKSAVDPVLIFSFMGVSTVSVPTAGTTETYTGFNRAATRVAVLETFDTPTFRQKVYFLSFSADYSTNTVDLKYDERYQTIVITGAWSDVGDDPRFTSVSSTTTFQGGAPMIRAIRPDGEEFSVIRANYLSYTGSQNGNAQQDSTGTNNIAYAQTSSSSSELQLGYISNQGYSTLFTFGTFSSLFSITRNGSGYVETDVINSSSTTPLTVFFSSVNKSALIREDFSSSAQTITFDLIGSNINNSSITAVQDRRLRYYVNSGNTAFQTDYSSGTSVGSVAPTADVFLVPVGGFTSGAESAIGGVESFPGDLAYSDKMLMFCNAGGNVSGPFTLLATLRTNAITTLPTDLSDSGVALHYPVSVTQLEY